MRTRRFSVALFGVWLTGLCAAMFPGCGAAGPSYSELLQTYNEEVKALDRIKEERQQVIAECEQAVKAKTDSMLSTVATMTKAADAVAAVDVEQGIAMHKEAQQTLREAQQTLQTYTEMQCAQRDQKLAEIDQRITEQLARVEAAEAKKDAAYK